MRDFHETVPLFSGGKFAYMTPKQMDVFFPTPICRHNFGAVGQHIQFHSQSPKAPPDLLFPTHQPRCVRVVVSSLKRGCVCVACDEAICTAVGLMRPR